MKKKIKKSENYLERVPMRAPHLNWRKDEKGNVTLEIENKGAFNRMAQMLLKKPKISYIHLDESGSFIWFKIDGEKNVIALGRDLEEKFGEKAYPLYERLAKYLRILESYGFIVWKNI